jgi:heme/copper-type cytochrome/quinol oxidase subunit 2
MSQQLWFLISVAVLAALLFIPVSKLIWVLSVRRLQRQSGRELSEVELEGQLRRARVIAAFVTLIFSFLFNANLLGLPGHG